MNDKSTAWMISSMQFIRQNIISHMVGLNPATIAKHTFTAAIQSMTEVGTAAWLREFGIIVGQYAASKVGLMAAGDRNWNFAHNKSEELQRRHRNAVEGITGNFDRVFGDYSPGVKDVMRDVLSGLSDRPLSESARLLISGFQGRYLQLRDWMHMQEARPIAFWDLMSAVPTWLARYRQAKIAGENEGNAIFMADRAVRRAHGSSAITSRAHLMRHNAIAMQFGNFYTFFSHILQRQVEMAWAFRAGLRGDGFYVNPPKITPDGGTDPPSIAKATKDRAVKEEMETEYRKTDGFKTSMALAPALSAMFVSYVIFPAVWDEIVSPTHGEKGIGPDRDESALYYATKVAGKGLGGSWLGVRDLTHAWADGGDPSAGLVGEGLKSVINVMKDMKTQTVVRRTPTQRKQKFIRDANQLLNMASGVGLPNSIPRMGIFGTNWYYGTEHPQTFRQFWTGITRGTVHPRHH